MTPVSQAVTHPDLIAREQNLQKTAETGHAGHPIHAPKPGVTAIFITDMRELFKVRVTGLVIVTGWAGF
jgi:hypothetical protein